MSPQGAKTILVPAKNPERIQSLNAKMEAKDVIQVFQKKVEQILVSTAFYKR